MGKKESVTTDRASGRQQFGVIRLRREKSKVAGRPVGAGHEQARPHPAVPRRQETAVGFAGQRRGGHHGARPLALVPDLHGAAIRHEDELIFPVTISGEAGGQWPGTP